MEINESKLIEKEVTLRLLRLTKETLETRRSIIRWLALSLGIINPGESRLSGLAVLDGLLYFQISQKKDPTVLELSEYINKTWDSINEKTLRYHLLQLKKMDIIKNSKSKYFLINNNTIDKNDETVWIDDYFNLIVEPIKNNLKRMIKELKNR
ncbi:MAG: hypothetical protein M1168_03530 [Candidatus Marsarchaeota archaeon]|nr:hypothetical protein [Candidatus Marsarchaeota archaeon]MCL5095024.1 hypothetical protein [Candidatus Marsarchaeota archaeon]